MESSTLLVVAIGLLAIVALVLVGAATPDGQRRTAGQAKKDSTGTQSVQAGLTGRVSARGVAADEASQPCLNLRIPPPDEVRLQAVAPKNEMKGGR